MVERIYKFFNEVGVCVINYGNDKFLFFLFKEVVRSYVYVFVNVVNILNGGV